MVRIIMDCFGGDRSPDANVEGSLLALRAHDDLELIFTGDETVLRQKMDEYGYTDAERARKTKPPCWRIRTPDETFAVDDGVQGRFEQNLARECGDFILRRADGVYAYQLAVVADDIDGGVTEVVRGDDLLPATPAQLLVLRALGLAAPSYCHVPLVVGPDGRPVRLFADAQVLFRRVTGFYTFRQIGNDEFNRLCAHAGSGDIRFNFDRNSTADSLD